MELVRVPYVRFAAISPATSERYAVGFGNSNEENRIKRVKYAFRLLRL